MSKCTDCNEYNQEKHYCPKFCDVIRNTDKEMREYYKDEHEKLEKIEQVVEKWESQVREAEEDFEFLASISTILDKE